MGNTRDDLVKNDDNTNEHNNQDNEDVSETELAERSILDTADEIINHDISISAGSGKQVLKCEECEASFKGKSGLYHHTSSKHEGICYSCKYCGYKATQQGHLKSHQESIHEGIRYSCDKCNYQATLQRHLKCMMV